MYVRSLSYASLGVFLQQMHRAGVNQPLKNCYDEIILEVVL